MSAHRVGGLVAKFADKCVELAFAAAVRDYGVKLSVVNRPGQRKPRAVVEQDFERLEIVDGLAVRGRMRAA